MRRRWLLILGGVVVLGVATVLAIALFAPQAPFRFLDEKDRVQLLPTWQPSKGESAYCWVADPESVVKEARAELSSGSFEEKQIYSQLGELVTAFSKEHKLDMALIYRNFRVSERDPQHFISARGWVTVIVVLEEPPGLWDRIKAVLRL